MRSVYYRNVLVEMDYPSHPGFELEVSLDTYCNLMFVADTFDGEIHLRRTPTFRAGGGVSAVRVCGERSDDVPSSIVFLLKIWYDA